MKKQQEEERRRLKSEELQQRKAKAGEDTSVADPVQAALERVKARKQALQEESS